MKISLSNIGSFLKEAFIYLYEKAKNTLNGFEVFHIKDDSPVSSFAHESLKKDSGHSTLVKSLKSYNITQASRTLLENEADHEYFRNILKGLDLKSKRNAVQDKKAIYSNFLKNIGHHWGIKGTVEIAKKKVQLEYNYLEITHANLSNSVAAYFKSDSGFAGKLSGEQKSLIETSLHRSLNYTYTSKSAAQALGDYQSEIPVTFGTGWQNHGVEITLYNGLLTYTDRSKPDSDSRMQIYKIGRELTVEDLKKLMITLRNQVDSSRRDWFRNGGMQKDLKLKPVETVVKKSGMKGAFCTWANVKGGFHSLLILVKAREYENQGMTLERAISKASAEARVIYKDWQWFHKKMDLETLLVIKEDIENGKSPMDKETYDDLCRTISQKITQKLAANKLPDAHALKLSEALAKLQYL